MYYIIYFINKKDKKVGNDFCEIINFFIYNFVIIKGIKIKIIFLFVCLSMLMVIFLVFCLYFLLIEIF